MIGCAGAKPVYLIHRIPAAAVDLHPDLKSLKTVQPPLEVSSIADNVRTALRNAWPNERRFVSTTLFMGDWVIWVEGHPDNVGCNRVIYTAEISPLALVNVQYIGEV